jgi:hypothetical protein
MSIVALCGLGAAQLAAAFGSRERGVE